MSQFLFLLFLQVITLTCLGLHYNSFSEATNVHTVMLVNGTFVGFSVILIALFAGYMMNTPINKRLGKTAVFWYWFKQLLMLFFTDLFFSLIGCAMFIASGVLILQYWNDTNFGKFHGIFANDSKNTGITKGSLAIVNGVLFLVDVVFTFRD